jgi:o-succinylbenzoate synthase
LLLRLMTDAGIAGLGEASPHPALGIQGVHEAEVALSRLASGLLGADADRLAAGLPEGIPPALACALDTAALDAIARSRGVPLARLLNDQARASVPVNATIASETAAAAADEAAAAAREAGFRCVKLKVGMAPNLEGERQRAAAVRRALGPDVKLRLDANGAWTVEQAVRTIRSLAEFGLEYVEQPVAPGDLSGMARVRRDGGVPIAADEDVSGVEAARRILEAGAADTLVIKPMVVGGLRPAMEIAAMARQAGASVVVTTTVDAGVGTAAALHLAAALPGEGPACGLATGSLLAGDIVVWPLVVRAGRMALPDGPGLGVELDEAALVRYATVTREVPT